MNVNSCLHEHYQHNFTILYSKKLKESQIYFSYGLKSAVSLTCLLLRSNIKRTRILLSTLVPKLKTSKYRKV